MPTGVPFESGADALKYERPGERGNQGSGRATGRRGEDGAGARTQVGTGPARSIEQATESARWSASVALFGMLLQESEHRGVGDYELVKRLTRGALGIDERGERAEFVQLVALVEDLRS